MQMGWRQIIDTCWYLSSSSLHKARARELKKQGFPTIRFAKILCKGSILGSLITIGTRSWRNWIKILRHNVYHSNFAIWMDLGSNPLCIQSFLKTWTWILSLYALQMGWRQIRDICCYLSSSSLQYVVC